LPVQTGGNWPVVPYNRDLFTRAGVPEPPAKWGDAKWTWDTFADACRRLTASMSQGGATGKWAVNLPVAGDWFFESHAYLWKASWLSDDWKTATHDSPAMLESFKAFSD